jgi:hypothetical protein
VRHDHRIKAEEENFGKNEKTTDISSSFNDFSGYTPAQLPASALCHQRCGRSPPAGIHETGEAYFSFRNSGPSRLFFIPVDT